MSEREPKFESETALVEAYCAWLAKEQTTWTVYHETAGWDLLLVEAETGVQVGVEAKLSLNPKVLEQALPGYWSDPRGPDYRAVLVPSHGLQNHMTRICGHLGITIISVRQEMAYNYKTNAFDRLTYRVNSRLPNEAQRWNHEAWFSWLPEHRCSLPAYIPDVTGGKAAPKALTDWKVRAIKLMIILERRGFVTRADMGFLKISPTRWTDRYHGFLIPGPKGYVRHDGTPDLKVDHPRNWVEIEADFDEWAKGLPA